MMQLENIVFVRKIVMINLVIETLVSLVIYMYNPEENYVTLRPSIVSPYGLYV